MTSFPRIPIVRQLSAAARFYHLFNELREDRHFISKQSKNAIIYVVDIDVLSVYVNPYQDQSRRYMRLFEPRSESGLDEQAKSLLYATARVTTDDLFVGKFANDVFILPVYRRQLLSMIRFFANLKTKDLIKDILTRGATARDNIASALKEGSEEFVLAKFRENAPYFLLSALTKDGPLDRLDTVTNSILTKNQMYIKELDSIQQKEPVWTDLYATILESKKDQIDRFDRDEGNLSDNIADDVNAILQIVNLNRKYRDGNVRFYFLTGDDGIHRTVDAIYLKSSHKRYEKLLHYEWPPFNFVRRPVQMSRFMQVNCLEYLDTNVAGRDIPQAFEQLLFLRHPRTQLHDAIYDENFQWHLSSYHDTAPLGRILTYRLSQIQNDILESRKAALAIQAKELSKSYELTSSALLDDNRLMELVERGLEQHLSRVQALLEMDPKGNTKALNDLLPMLLSIDSAQAEDHRISAGLSHRLQSIPNFPDDVLDALRDIIEPAEHRGARERASAIYRIPPGWLFLFNAYLSALLNKWPAALQQSLSAIDYADRVQLARSDRREFYYFAAVSCRHILDPGPDTLIRGVEYIAEALDISHELRYLVEKAAYGLSIPYHHKHYGNYQKALEYAPSPGATYDLLLEAELAANKYRHFTDDSIISLCFWVQLYCNLCSVYLYARYLNVEYFQLDRTITVTDVERYCEALYVSIERRGGEKNVSAIVRFIYYATMASLAAGRPDAQELGSWKTKIERLLAEMDGKENQDPGIVASDRRKVQEFLQTLDSWYGGNVGRN